MSSFLRIVGLFLSLTLTICAKAQNSSKAINIGDKIPDIELKGIINYPLTSMKISDFKGKLLILDFWATWCSPCIASFPKIDSLRKEFDSKLEILPVTTEDSSTVKFFLNKMNNAYKIRTTSVTKDRILNKLFPHVYIPHYVWISSEGVVLAITGVEEVNSSNIARIISGNNLNLTVKKDMLRSIVVKKGNPVFILGTYKKNDSNESQYLAPVMNSEIALSSVMSRYIEGMSSGISKSDTTLITVRNMTIPWLYRQAFWHNKAELLNNSKFVIDINDPVLREKLVNSDSQDVNYWIKNNTYCYELRVPPEMANKLYDYMVSDLNSYFGAIYGIEGVIELRKQKYLALVRTELSGDRIATKGGVPDVKKNAFYLKIQNQRLSRLIGELLQPLQLYPFIEDETNYKGKVDLEINARIGNLDNLNTELERYGLKLVEKEKKSQMVVIRKRQTI